MLTLPDMPLRALCAVNAGVASGNLKKGNACVRTTVDGPRQPEAVRRLLGRIRPIRSVVRKRAFCNVIDRGYESSMRQG